MNDVPAVHPATAAVRVRAFLEAAERGLQDGDYPFDPRNGRTVISCAPGASGQVVPLYVDDLMALIEDHRGEIENVRSIQTQPDQFAMRELVLTPPLGIPMHGRFKMNEVPLTQTKRYSYPTPDEMNEALDEQLCTDNASSVPHPDDVYPDITIALEKLNNSEQEPDA